MWSFMRSWADWTEERFKGRVLERSAMVVCRGGNGLLGLSDLVDHLYRVSLGSVTLDNMNQYTQSA